MVPRNFFQLHGSTWGHSSSSYTYRTYNRKCYVARHRFNCFAYINAFNSYTNPVEEININTSILKLRKLRHTQPATEGPVFGPLKESMSLWRRVGASLAFCYYGFANLPELRVNVEIRISLLYWLYTVT